MKPFFLIILVSSLLFSVGFSQEVTIRQGLARFETNTESVGPDLKFSGEGNGLSGTISFTDSTFSFSFDLNKLKTGIRLRDIHMYEDYLETDRFPVATFTGKFKAGKKTGELIAKGTFSLHGVSKDQVVVGLISNGILTAFWDLRLSDYKIDTPEKFLIGKVSDILKMSATIKLE